MKNKALKRLVLIALILIFLGACKQSSENSSFTGTLRNMHATGKLDVCYSVYPPTVIKNLQNGELSGHLIDSLEAILREVNVKPNYIETSWGTAAAALRTKRCSLVVAAYFVKIPRAFTVSFSDPLFYVGDGALVKKGDTRFSHIMNANHEDVTIAVVNGESGHEYVKTYLPKAKKRVISIEGGDLSRIFLEVTSGRADIAVTDVMSAKRFSENNKSVEALFVDKPFNMNPVSWAVRHEDQAFLQFINSSLDVLRINRKLVEFQERYDAHWLQEVKQLRIH